MNSIGEVYICNKDSDGGPILLNSFKGVTIKSICGGGNRVYIIEEVTPGIGRVHSLHPPEYDDFDFTFTSVGMNLNQRDEIEAMDDEENEADDQKESNHYQSNRAQLGGEYQPYEEADNMDQNFEEGEDQPDEVNEARKLEEENSISHRSQSSRQKAQLSTHLDEHALQKNASMSQSQPALALPPYKLEKIISNKTHTFFLTENEEHSLFSAGYGDYSILGHGSESMTPVREIKNLAGKQVKQLATGYGHAVAVTAQGDIYSWGRGFEGQLGLELEYDPSKNKKNSLKLEVAAYPRLLRFFHKLKSQPEEKFDPHSSLHIAEKKDKSDLEKKKMDFFNFDNIKQYNTMKDYLKDVYPGNLVREVACGAFHSMAITENGAVYGWGANDCQQLGFKGKREVWAPVRIPIPLPVSQIACGFAHTVALLQNGRIVTFGLNHKYQLGLGDNRRKLSPQILEVDDLDQELPNFVQIQSGDYNNFALSQDGVVYSWGSGVLGFKEETSISRPRQISGTLSDRKVSHIYANTGNAIFFSPLCIKSMKPSSGPYSGETVFSIIGTGLCDLDGKQKIKFEYGTNLGTKEGDSQDSIRSYSVEVPLVYDSYTDSYTCTTPNFEAPAIYDNVKWPLVASIKVSLDGESWIDCEPKFFIYDANVRVTGLNPKYGNKEGGIEIAIESNANEETLGNFVNVNIGFQPIQGAAQTSKLNTQRTNNSFNDMSQDEDIHQSEIKQGGRQKETSQLRQRSSKVSNPVNLEVGSSDLQKLDWKCFNAKVRNGKISFVSPNLSALYPGILNYHVDISLNGQQFLGSPSVFRYYDIKVGRIFPTITTQEGSTLMTIEGEGLFDTIAKKIKLENSFGARMIDAKWDKITNSFFFYTPPISWLAGNEVYDEIPISKLMEEEVKISLTINGGVEWIYVGTYIYYEPVIKEIIPGPEPDKKVGIKEIELEWETPEPIVDPLAGLTEKEAEKKKQEIEKKKKDDAAEIEFVPRAPGGFLFIRGKFMHIEEPIKARFSVANVHWDAPCIFKNEKKLGVRVPLMECHVEGVKDVQVSLSFNGGQQFSKASKTIKYLFFNKDVPQTAREKLFDEEIKKAKKVKK